MCAISVVYDSLIHNWQNRYWPNMAVAGLPITEVPPPTPTEIEELHVLVNWIRDYDRRTGQPDCESEVKRDILRKMAKLLGITLTFI